MIALKGMPKASYQKLILTYPFFSLMQPLLRLNRICWKRNNRFASSTMFTYTSTGATTTFYLFHFRKK